MAEPQFRSDRAIASFQFRALFSGLDRQSLKGVLVNCVERGEVRLYLLSPQWPESPRLLVRFPRLLLTRPGRLTAFRAFLLCETFYRFS
jgi:hypothetical protein